MAVGYSVEGSTDSAWATLFYALGYNLALLTVMAVVYDVTHRLSFWHRMLAPRNAVGERGALARPLLSALHTAREVLFTPEAEVIRVSGLDGAVWVRYFYMTIQLFGILCCTAFPVLVGFYQAGGNPDNVTGIDQLSLSHVSPMAPTMWATLVMLYFVSGTVFFLCWRHTLYVLHLRKLYFKAPERANERHHYAAIVTCIPPPPPPARTKPPKAGAAAATSAANDRPAPLSPGDLLDAAHDILEGLFHALTCCIRTQALGLSEPKWIPLAPSSSSADDYDTITTRADVALMPPGPASDEPVKHGPVGGIARVVGKNEADTHDSRPDAGQPQEGQSPGPPGSSNSEVGGVEEDGRRRLKCQQYAQTGEPLCPPHVADFFERLFGDDILHIQPVYNESAVSTAHTRWRHAIRRLNECRMDWEAAQQARAARQAAGGVSLSSTKLPADGKEKAPADGSGAMPGHAAGRWRLFGGSKAESIPYWIDQVKEAAEGLRLAQEKALQNPVPSSVIAVFKSRRVAALCREALRPSGHWTWRAFPAPPPHEMWWENLHRTAFRDNVRAATATVLSLLLVVFFYVPVAGIASLATGRPLGNLLDKQPPPQQQQQQQSSNWLPSSLEAIVPSLAMHGVLSFFSPLFMFIARWEGRTSLGEAMLVSSSRFFHVAVANVLIGYSLTSSLFSEIQDLVAGKTTLWGLLAAHLPGKAAFYIQYTLNTTVMSTLELGRFPVHILAFLFKRSVLGTRKSDVERHWDQGPLDYDSLVGYQNLIVTFGIVYSIISPFILPFSLLFSLVACYTWKTQVMYVYRDPSDQGGVYWLRFVHHTLHALLICQVTTIGMLGVKHAYTQMGIASGTVILTVIFYMGISAHFGTFFSREPLELLAEVENDIEDIAKTVMGDPAKLAGHYFPQWMQPPKLPNLDPMAPPDPDIWQQMHPTRRLVEVEKYFPTPRGLDGEAGVHDRGLAEPRDSSEKAFWSVVGVNSGILSQQTKEPQGLQELSSKSKFAVD